jgi:hypothetical protein
MGGRIMTKWLHGEKYPKTLVSDVTHVKGGKIEHTITEEPLLHLFCNEDHFGTVNVDIDPDFNPDVVADVLQGLPFDDNEFAACFADFPWVNNWMKNTSIAIKEMLRVAPVAYVMSPWLYGASWCTPTEIKVSWRPGVNKPILFVKYVRKDEHQRTLWEPFK